MEPEIVTEEEFVKFVDRVFDDLNLFDMKYKTTEHERTEQGDTISAVIESVVQGMDQAMEVEEQEDSDRENDWGEDLELEEFDDQELDCRKGELLKLPTLTTTDKR